MEPTNQVAWFIPRSWDEIVAAYEKAYPGFTVKSVTYSPKGFDVIITPSLCSVAKQ